ncbi:MAG: hypoxanthine phosphoribosyltransferase [Ignavibacteria bacterium]|nr:hypoxanthine phosphoribosyltransferase [Ignavibacteria bacterium]
MTESRIRILDKSFKPYISAEKIEEAVVRIASEINKHHAGNEITVLVILKGAMMFASDLLRKLNMPCTVEFLRASSYRNSISSSGLVNIEDWIPDVTDRNVIIIEDIVDTGTTIRELIKHLSSYHPASVSVAAILSKPEVHEDQIAIEYVGINIPADFVVGYGMDYAGQGRHLNSIWVVDDTPDTL